MKIVWQHAKKQKLLDRHSHFYFNFMKRCIRWWRRSISKRRYRIYCIGFVCFDESVERKIHCRLILRERTEQTVDDNIAHLQSIADLSSVLLDNPFFGPAGLDPLPTYLDQEIEGEFITYYCIK